MRRWKHGGCPRGRQPKKYTAWCNIKRRITREDHPAFKDYGGRGITMCAEWQLGYAAFDRDVPDPPEEGFGCTIDRIDNERGYEPGNVRWTDRKTQANNKRPNGGPVAKRIEYLGRVQSLKAWSREFGVNYQTAHSRLRRGMSIGEALGKV